MSYIIPISIGLSCYMLSSYILLRYPTILHKKRKLKFTAVHISHRGGCAEKLENTMSAFINAERRGTDMLELDCQLTRDGIVMVSHDNNLMRLCGQDISISDIEYKEIPLLKETLLCQFNDSMVTASNEADRRFVTLREVFERFPGMPINVDIKTNNSRLIDKVAELIVEFDREDITVWGNIKEAVTIQCADRLPNTPILFSFNRVIVTLLLYYSGLLPFFSMRESCFEIMMINNYLRGDDSLLSRLKHWLIEAVLINGKLFGHLTSRGIQVYIWVLNEERDYKRAYDLGATGVMTDKPTELGDFLRAEHIVTGHKQ